MHNDNPTMQDILAELKEIKAMLALLLNRQSSADANVTASPPQAYNASDDDISDSTHDNISDTDTNDDTDAITNADADGQAIADDDELTATATIDDDATTSDQSAAPLPLMRHFSLNDKYRYRRELFGGSDRIMYDTLSVLSAMHSVDEATDYLFNDLGWQDTNPDVADFVNVITNYYQ